MRGPDNECYRSWKNRRCNLGWWSGKAAWWRRHLGTGEETLQSDIGRLLSIEGPGWLVSRASVGGAELGER